MDGCAEKALQGAFRRAAKPEAPDTTRGLGTATDQIHPRLARVVHQANCFQSIFGSQTSLDFIIFSQLTSSPV